MSNYSELYLIVANCREITLKLSIKLYGDFFYQSSL